MSETTTLLKTGATDLVLRMAEAATAPPAVTLASPVQALGEVSRDITGRSLLRLADGRQASALDIQRDYLARARDLAGERGADAARTRTVCASSDYGSGRWTQSGRTTLTPSPGRSTG
jgi:proteasome accessory factor A